MFLLFFGKAEHKKFHEQIIYMRFMCIFFCFSNSEVQGLELNAFLKNATAERMPFDSHCGVQPIVFTSDQCNSNDINNIDAINAGSKLLENAQKKFVPHVSPYVCIFKLSGFMFNRVNVTGVSAA